MTPAEPQPRTTMFMEGSARGARSADDRAHPPARAAARLSEAMLLALQLHARAYTPRQIAALRGVPLDEVVRDLQRAAARLGSGTVTRAIAEARRRGLID